ncbi:MAG: Ubiquinone/menaquinone biosynthesis C-methyltransferase UbiE [Flavobacteriales bacterium]|nr:Ubiquinone/menaquinone biosynthesis C-methyltransferase UbiE [Flavobacteriales bacterium]NUQ14116.1 class I SAM-dependent methyltransferase [Flavobacteriales bacterium]
MNRTRPNPRTDPRWVAARYDRVAWCYPWLEKLFLVPTTARREAMTQLMVQPGQRVLMVGCGLGRSLPRLAALVGDSGRVVAVDLSPVMVAKARSLCARHGLALVDVRCENLLEHLAPSGYDRIWFEFSLNSFGDPQAALQQAWSLLRPGGRCVVLDGRLPPRLNWLTRRTMPVIRWLLERTVLGDPDMDPSNEVVRAGRSHQLHWFRGGTWFVATMEKSTTIS